MAPIYRKLGLAGAGITLIIPVLLLAANTTTARNDPSQAAARVTPLSLPPAREIIDPKYVQTLTTAQLDFSNSQPAAPIASWNRLAPYPAAATSDGPTVLVENPSAVDPGRWESATVAAGDTLSAIFSRLGLTQRTLHEMLQLPSAREALTNIRPGEEIRLRLEADQLHELVYAADPLATLVLRRAPDGWQTTTVTTPTESRPRYVSGVIDESFYAAALRSGLDDRLIMETAGIFGWDIDFALDIRAGDSFTLVHEEIYNEHGEKLLDGPILAASFTNQERTFSAIRFTTTEGRTDYYAPDGFAMRKAFLRSPVDFRRISSRFVGARYHPVLGVKRPHRGVDYAAATGTPIKAAGDGKVVHLGNKGGYGRTVILQHGGRYRTLYAHMSRYARGLRNGQRVTQGQTIGHVGASGMATGPHLHYEFLVDGVHRNPLTVDLPKADPLTAAELPRFRAIAGPLLAQLEVQQRQLLAQIESPAEPGPAR